MNPSHTPQQPSNEAPTSSWGSKVLPVFIVLLLALAGWRLSESDQRISHLEEELTDTTVELETLSDENDRHASALQQSSQLLADLSSKAAAQQQQNNLEIAKLGQSLTAADQQQRQQESQNKELTQQLNATRHNADQLTAIAQKTAEELQSTASQLRTISISGGVSQTTEG